jgi:septum formation protein
VPQNHSDLKQRRIILASSSPRRKEFLERTGLKFTVDPSEYPEHLCSDLSPEGLVKALSIGKAAAVARKYQDAVIIAADTIGVVRRTIIGKPHTEAEARKMLELISGKSHRVITGLTLIDSKTNKMVTRIVETRVYIKKLSPQEIRNYVKSGEPLDKAGAYAIQGLGSVIVQKIIGDFYNVVGLPLNTLAECLKIFGVDIL